MTLSFLEEQWVLQSTCCTTEEKVRVTETERKSGMLCISSMVIQRKIETRAVNVHLRSTDII